MKVGFTGSSPAHSLPRLYQTPSTSPPRLFIFQGMQIYVGRAGQREGPFTLVEVRAMLTAGQLRPDDLAWHEGTPDWISVNQLPGLIPHSPAAAGPPGFPSSDQGGSIRAGQTQTLPAENYDIVSLVLGILGLILIPIIEGWRLPDLSPAIWESCFGERLQPLSA